MLRRMMMASGGGGAPADPFWANVVALLHFDGADGSTTFTDVTGRAWTGTGGISLSTSSPLVGSASLLNDGASLKSIETVDVIPDIPLDGDYTVELLFNLDTLRPLAPLFTIYESTSAYRLLAYTTDDRIQLASPGALSAPLYSAGLAAGTTYHFAVSRQGTNTRTFLNGSLLGTWANSGFSMLGQRIRFGRDHGNNWRFFGRMDEIRVTLGVARYTAAFTPPSFPLPDS